MSSLPLAACAVCVAQNHSNGFLILGGAVALLSIALALGLAWRDRRAVEASRRCAEMADDSQAPDRS